MSDRSLRSDVRNPVLGLPAIQGLQSLPPETRTLIAGLLKDLVSDARERAQESWRKNKGPMAAYWKAVGAYGEHIRRAVRP